MSAAELPSEIPVDQPFENRSVETEATQAEIASPPDAPDLPVTAADIPVEQSVDTPVSPDANEQTLPVTAADIPPDRPLETPTGTLGETGELAASIGDQPEESPLPVTGAEIPSEPSVETPATRNVEESPLPMTGAELPPDQTLGIGQSPDQPDEPLSVTTATNREEPSADITFRGEEELPPVHQESPGGGGVNWMDDLSRQFGDELGMQLGVLQDEFQSTMRATVSRQVLTASLMASEE